MPIEVPNLPAVVLSTEKVEGIRRPQEQPRRKQRQFFAQLEKQTEAKDGQKASALDRRDREQKKQNKPRQNRQESSIKAARKSKEDDAPLSKMNAGQRIDIKI